MKKDDLLAQWENSAQPLLVRTESMLILKELARVRKILLLLSVSVGLTAIADIVRSL